MTVAWPTLGSATFDGWVDGLKHVASDSSIFQHTDQMKHFPAQKEDNYQFACKISANYAIHGASG